MTLFWSDLWSKLLKSYLSFSLASHKKKNRCKSIVLQRFLVHLAGANSNSLLEDLKRINQLKDSPFQYEVDENQPNGKQSQIKTTARKLKR
ncbi:MAG: hypothetical protein BGO34_04630 [Bacteroidia bacterium 44-10]|nr:MAG: hypothetical protein BGO34_04630 [Bacteroidia bacterium 44-10]